MKWWDKSWNPITGCVPCSEACENCQSILNLKRQGRNTFPEISKSALEKDLLPGLNYVVSSLGDFFSPFSGIGWQTMDRIFKKMVLQKHSHFFLCTKYPEELRDYLKYAPWSKSQMDHIFFGVSVEKQKYLSRLDAISEIEEISHIFLSLEPLLEEVKVDYSLYPKVEWVIISSESGEKRRPAKEEWIRSAVLDASRSRKVYAYINYMELDSQAVDDLVLFPKDLQIRMKPSAFGRKELERKDFLDGCATLSKTVSGFEVTSNFPLFLKLSQHFQEIEILSFTYRGEIFLKSSTTRWLWKMANGIRKTFLENDQKTISKNLLRDFLPKETKVTFSIPEEFSFVSEDKQVQEFLKTYSKFTATESKKVCQ